MEVLQWARENGQGRTCYSFRCRAPASTATGVHGGLGESLMPHYARGRRGPGCKPSASSYTRNRLFLTRKRLSIAQNCLFLSLSTGVHWLPW